MLRFPSPPRAPLLVGTRAQRGPRGLCPSPAELGEVAKESLELKHPQTARGDLAALATGVSCLCPNEQQSSSVSG